MYVSCWCSRSCLVSCVRVAETTSLIPLVREPGIFLGNKGNGRFGKKLYKEEDFRPVSK